jgi:hypothetical protein
LQLGSHGIAVPQLHGLDFERPKKSLPRPHVDRPQAVPHWSPSLVLIHSSSSPFFDPALRELVQSRISGAHVTNRKQKSLSDGEITLVPDWRQSNMSAVRSTTGVPPDSDHLALSPVDALAPSHWIHRTCRRQRSGDSVMICHVQVWPCRRQGVQGGFNGRYQEGLSYGCSGTCSC